MLVSADGDEAAWRLRCACGSEQGTVLGHPLGDLKPGFEGSGIMVSPFRFGCAAYRGEGEPAPAACPACRGQVVGGVVTVTCHDERVEDRDADPAFPLADFFNWFRLDCTCRRWRACRCPPSSA